MGEEVSARSQVVRMIDLSLINTSELNPRKHFDEEKLTALAASIKEKGLLQPIVVRPQNGGYSIIAGERRFRAANLLGLLELPARVLEAGDQEALELAITENLQREDIDPIEEAKAYADLVNLGRTHREIAALVGKDHATIANAVRLLVLPEDVQADISDGKLTASHGRAIAGNVDRPEIMAKQIEYARSGRTTKEVESFVRDCSYQLERAGISKTMHTWDCPFKFKQVCKDCADYRAGQGDSGICLKPSCYQEKEKAEQEREKKRVEGQLKKEIVNLDGLNHNAYKRTPRHDIPACKEKAECEFRKKGRWGTSGSSFEICLNPRCYTRLMRAKEKAEREERLGKAAPLFEKVAAVISGDDIPKIRVMACWSTIQAANNDELKRAIEALGLPLDASKFQQYEDKHCAARLEELYRLPDVTLARLCARIVYEYAYKNTQNGWGRGTAFDWAAGSLGVEQKDEPEQTAPAAEVEEDQEQPPTFEEAAHQLMTSEPPDHGADALAYSVRQEAETEPPAVEPEAVPTEETALAAGPRVYLHETQPTKGRMVICVHQASPGGPWGTYKTIAGSGVFEQIRNKSLPLVGDQETAQANLDEWAAEQGMFAYSEGIMQEPQSEPAEQPGTTELPKEAVCSHAEGHIKPRKLTEGEIADSMKRIGKPYCQGHTIRRIADLVRDHRAQQDCPDCNSGYCYPLQDDSGKWRCSECGVTRIPLFQPAEVESICCGTIEELVSAADEPAVEPTVCLACKKGMLVKKIMHLQYWYCPECGAVFAHCAKCKRYWELDGKFDPEHPKCPPVWCPTCEADQAAEAPIGTSFADLPPGTQDRPSLAQIAEKSRQEVADMGRGPQ